MDYDYYYYYFVIIFIIIIISIIIIHILTILINNCQMIFSLFRIIKNTTLLPLFQKNTIISLFQSYSLIDQMNPKRRSENDEKWRAGEEMRKIENKSYFVDKIEFAP
jgi:hypothetical protein